MSLADSTKRKVFGRLSIAMGNTLQTAGMVAAYFALTASRSAQSPAVAVATMLLAWILLYFSSHAIAHWLVGRLVGIRFLFYTGGGTGNPEGCRGEFAGSLSISLFWACRPTRSRCKTSVPVPKP